MSQTTSDAVGKEEDLRLRLQGLQHDVEKSGSLVRRLAVVAIILVILLILLLISLQLYHVMQYAGVESVEASALTGRAGAAQIRYKSKTAGKIEFVRESEGLVQTLTEYAEVSASDKPGGKFTWSGQPGERSMIRVTYRDGLFLTTKDLPVDPRGAKP